MIESLAMLIVLLVAMGWFTRCCGELECDICQTGTLPSPIALTLSGWAADECDYVWMNGTFALYGYLDPSSSYVCLRDIGSVQRCTFLGSNVLYFSLSAEAVILDSGNYGWRATMTIQKADEIQTVIYEWDSGGTSPFDCSAEQSLSLISDSGGDLYDASASSAVIN